MSSNLFYRLKSWFAKLGNLTNIRTWFTKNFGDRVEVNWVFLFGESNV